MKTEKSSGRDYKNSRNSVGKYDNPCADVGSNPTLGAN